MKATKKENQSGKVSSFHSFAFTIVINIKILPTDGLYNGWSNPNYAESIKGKNK